MIDTQNLSKTYGSRTAVDGITFHVPRGEIVGFLGPNGAGKSTTLKILSGFIPPSSGRATVGGRDVVEESIEARKLIGYMPESVPLYPEMRVEEYLQFRAEIKGVGRTRKPAVDRALELADITDVRRRLVGELSKGYKQRVGLADALIASPPLLILDEPTEGLDPNQILRVREVIRSLGKDHTIFLSTHILPEVEAVCSRVVIIHQGRIAAEGPLDTIRAELQGNAREVALVLRLPETKMTKIPSPEAQLRALLADFLREHATVTLREAPTLAEKPADEAANVNVPERSLGPVPERSVVRAVVATPGDGAAGAAALEALVAACVRAGCGVREVVPRARSLETVFHELTTRDAAEGAAKES